MIKKGKELARNKRIKEAQGCLADIEKAYVRYVSHVGTLLSSATHLVVAIRKRHPAKTDASSYVPKRKGISVRFPGKERADLEKICTENGYTMSHFLSVFLEECLSGAATFTGAKLIDDRPIKAVQELINALAKVVFKPKKLWNYLRVNIAAREPKDTDAKKRFAYETKEKLQGLINELRAALNDMREGI